MTWDLKLNAQTRDLEPGIVTGVDEVIQRLITRLNREFGEWFLDVSVGLPFYQNGKGLLGSKNKNALELLIRKETLGTQGVNRIVKLNTRYNSADRSINIYMQLIVEDVGLVDFYLNEENTTWQLSA